LDAEAINGAFAGLDDGLRTRIQSQIDAIIEAAKENKRLLNESSLIEKRLAELADKMKLASENFPIAARALISLNLARGTLVLVGIYLVTVFMSLHRYSTKMALALEGRAHALNVMETVGPAEKFEKLAESLGGGGLDFGKSATPSANMIEMFKAIAPLAKRG